MLFEDRKEAGKKLAKKSKKHNIQAEVVLGSSLKSYDISKEIAGALNAEHGLILTDRIYVPGKKEDTVAGVTDDGTIWVDDRVKKKERVSGAFIDRARIVKTRLLGLEKEKHQLENPGLSNKKVMIVEEGISDGITTAAAVGSALKQGAKTVIVASPLISRSGARLMSKISDKSIFIKEFRFIEDINNHYSETAEERDRHSNLGPTI